jgi:hypothetical protein
MSESQQNTLLDKSESRRRWRVIRLRAIVAVLCAVPLAIGAAPVVAR